ncbi:MAG: TlpA family protein disulfide reductase [Acidiferrobacteraceae bacterium]|nr:TlpA family protein disulfide reductase [Acidiferrobacteraceae bacterium]
MPRRLTVAAFIVAGFIAGTAAAASVIASATGPGDLFTPVPSQYGSPLKLHLKDLDGRPRALPDFLGRVLVVNFWASWCTPCVKELPSMQVVRNRLAAEPFELIAVNVGEDAGQVAAFLQRFDPPLDFPVLLDENMVVTKQWKVRALPTSYIVDRSGRARYIATGARNFDAPEVFRAIRALLAENSTAEQGG